MDIPEKNASDNAKSYIDTIIKQDFVRLGEEEGFNYSPLLLKSLARNESTTAPNSKTLDDIKAYDKES